MPRDERMRPTAQKDAGGRPRRNNALNCRIEDVCSSGVCGW